MALEEYVHIAEVKYQLKPLTNTNARSREHMKDQALTTHRIVLFT